jgi:ferredoxin
LKIESTFEAKISLGFREGYTDVIHNIDEVKEICQQYCNEVGLCVTITPTNFIYVNGQEAGCFIGLINYPRFPSTSEDILSKALELAKIFLEEFKQNKVSVICNDKTYMIESE